MASIEYSQVSPLFVKGDAANRCMLGNERERDGVTGIDLVGEVGASAVESLDESPGSAPRGDDHGSRAGDRIDHESGDQLGKGGGQALVRGEEFEENRLPRKADHDPSLAIKDRYVGEVNTLPYPVEMVDVGGCRGGPHGSVVAGYPVPHLLLSPGFVGCVHCGPDIA